MLVLNFVEQQFSCVVLKKGVCSYITFTEEKPTPSHLQ